MLRHTRLVVKEDGLTSMTTAAGESTAAAAAAVLVLVAIHVKVVILCMPQAVEGQVDKSVPPILTLPVKPGGRMEVMSTGTAVVAVLLAEVLLAMATTAMAMLPVAMVLAAVVATTPGQVGLVVRAALPEPGAEVEEPGLQQAAMAALAGAAK